MSDKLELQAADGRLFPVYKVAPLGPPRAAVVVVPEIFGVNSHIRAVTSSWAAQGYLALAPATFDRVQPGVELGYGEADMALGMGYKAAVEALPSPGVLQDLQAVVDYASQVGRVGMVGCCWGGLLAWRAAAELSGLAAVVTYYGGGMTVGAELERQPPVPVLAHFGDRDPWIAQASVQAFCAAQPAVQVHRYAASHGFHCDQRGSYDAPAAQLAQARTQAFWMQHL